MLRIALRCLLFERNKAASALAGVAIAGTLAIVQLGVYLGFLETSSALIARSHGELWVMAKGTRVLENAQPLASGTRSEVLGPACVRRARGFIVGMLPASTDAGAEEAVEVFGIELVPEVVLPWNLRSPGLASDLRGPLRVSVDALDLEKLRVRDNPIGARLSIAGRSVSIALVTQGIRSFQIMPQIFAQLGTARRVLGLSDGQVHYWILDLHDPVCAGSVVQAIERHPDLEVRTPEAFARTTQEYWVGSSGAGIVLAFVALLGLTAGSVIVAQTLYALTCDRLSELGTLVAFGATRAEIARLVLWQAGFLALSGGMLALGMSSVLGYAAATAGIRLVLSPAVAAVGVAAVAGVCALASLSSVRRVLAVDAAEVLR